MSIKILVDDKLVYEGPSGNVEVAEEGSGFRQTQVVNNHGNVGSQYNIGSVGSIGSVKQGIRVRVEGDITGNLKAAGSVHCHDIGQYVEAKGSVEIDGNVAGFVDLAGSLEMKGDIGGDVNAGGSIECRDIKGKAKAGGSIDCRSKG